MSGCEYGVFFLQGPPGTGKTSAILGIVAGLLSPSNPTSRRTTPEPDGPGGRGGKGDKAGQGQFKRPSAAKHRQAAAAAAQEAAEKGG